MAASQSDPERLRKLFEHRRIARWCLDRRIGVCNAIRAGELPPLDEASMNGFVADAEAELDAIEDALAQELKAVTTTARLSVPANDSPRIRPTRHSSQHLVTDLEA
jgi:hypothetical protein